MTPSAHGVKKFFPEMSCLRSCSVGSACPSIPATLARHGWEAWECGGGAWGQPLLLEGARSQRESHIALVFATYWCERCLFFLKVHFCCRKFSSTRVSSCACVQACVISAHYRMLPEGKIPQAILDPWSSQCLSPGRSDGDAYFLNCPH